MKRLKLLAAALLVSSSSIYAAEAGFKTDETPPPSQKQDAGYKGTEATMETTVKQFLTQKDNMWVTMEGHITKKAGNNRYSFRDKTGSTTLVIPHSIWRKPYNSKDLVRVSGRVKVKSNERILNVERLEIP